MEALSIPECVAPPMEAYRFWPHGEAVTYGEQKKTVRLIFYRVQFTPFEEEQFAMFEVYMRDKFPSFAYPEWFVKEERIRVLLGCKFDMRKSAEAVFASIEWRNSFAPRSFYSLFEQCQNVLQTGAIYIHGRDHRYRPLLVLNVERLDLARHAVEEYRALICFLLEFMSKQMMIPGQVENWVVITDLCRTSLFDLPVSELKSLIKLLQDNFRCRMTVNYIVNAPTSITFAWRVVKVAIEEHTLKKIRILKSGTIDEMRSHFATHQYEAKYGGSAPNATVFWPPVMPPGPYHTEKETADGHLSETSSYHEYFPLPRESVSTGVVQDTGMSQEDHIESEVQSPDTEKLKIEFVKVPMIKQDTEDIPDPDAVSLNEYHSLEPVPAPLPPPQDDEPSRGCCLHCRRRNCVLI